MYAFSRLPSLALADAQNHLSIDSKRSLTSFSWPGMPVEYSIASPTASFSILPRSWQIEYPSLPAHIRTYSRPTTAPALAPTTSPGQRSPPRPTSPDPICAEQASNHHRRQRTFPCLFLNDFMHPPGLRPDVPALSPVWNTERRGIVSERAFFITAELTVNILAL